MNFNELIEKNKLLLAENKKLKEKIKLLENQMGKKKKLEKKQLKKL